MCGPRRCEGYTSSSFGLGDLQMTVTVQTCFWKGYVKKNIPDSTQNQQNTQILSTSSLTNKTNHQFDLLPRFSPRLIVDSMVELAPKVCTRSSAFIYIYTNTYKHLVYIICIYHNVQLFAFKHNEWYNISGFHSKACGFHSLIASNL